MYVLQACLCLAGAAVDGATYLRLLDYDVLLHE